MRYFPHSFSVMKIVDIGQDLTVTNID